MTKRYQSIADVRRANKSIGHHYLDTETMRFFGSTIESTLYDGRVFIMSQFDGFESKDLGPRGRRVFRVLEALESGEIVHRQPEDVDTDKVIHRGPNRGPVMVENGDFSHLADAQQYARDYVRGIEYHVQGNYGNGWETVTVADSHMMAGETLKDYESAEPDYSHRVRRVRTLEA